VLDIVLKHKHLFGAEVVPWTLSWIKISFISFSLSICQSISLSLIPPSLSLKTSSPKFTCGHPLWHLSQDTSPHLFTTFYIRLPIPYQVYKLWSRKNSSVVIESFQLSHPTHTLPFVSSSQWHIDNLICTVVYIAPYLAHRSTYFHPRSYEGLSQD